MLLGVKLVSWNIQWGRGADGRVDLDRIVEHARRFADFDVLCLQEVAVGYPQLPGFDGSDQFAALAARLPGYTAIDGVAMDVIDPGAGRHRFGNMILSRLPVRQAFRHLLPWPVDASVRSMQRIAVEATIAAPFGVLRVTTTHLEYYSHLQRTAQVDRLRELHRQAVAQARNPHPGKPEDGPFDSVPRGGLAMLVGDHNFGPEAPEHAQLVAPFDDGTPAYLDAWRVVHGNRPHDPTVGVHDKEQWPGPAFTFDFAFISADLAPRLRDVKVDATSDASDHQPILIELA
jgi:endonuclease/exonuclease/phosphatase family metal-dependent hydrolase